MQIKRLEIRNYRALESLDLEFPSFYTAICGRNDAGKTNIVRALRALMNVSDAFGFRSAAELSMKDDFPKWSGAEIKSRQITVSLTVEVYPDADGGLYQFLLTHLSLKEDTKPLKMRLLLSHTAKDEDGEDQVSVSVGGKEYTGSQAQDILKRLQTSDTMLFYNSTELDPRLRFGRGFGGFFGNSRVNIRANWEQ